MHQVYVLGVDPGLTRCGLGLVAGPAARPTMLDRRCVRTGTELTLERRLRVIHDAVLAAIERYGPDAMAVERVLFSSNVRTAMSTGQAAGVALLAAAQTGVPVHAYSPTDVKLTVAGHGAADKDAMGRMVAAQLDLEEPPRPADVADALAVALCHLARSRLDGAASDAPAAAALATAAADARRDGRGGWEGVLARRRIGPAHDGGGT